MNPFNPTPSAWIDAIIFISALAILGYTAFIMWPCWQRRGCFCFGDYSERNK